MQVSEYIRNKIDRFSKGYVFTYNDFVTDVNKKEAVIKCLNRMALSGKIKKVSKGKFYKPEVSVFGELIPEKYQLVKDLLEKDGKVLGYITGLGIYNQMQLTTQVSGVIQIGRNEVRPVLKRGIYRISFIKQKNNITKENIPLLQILDAIRYIKKIPDTTISNACKRLLAICKALKLEDRELMVKLAMKYSPATRALVAALLDQLGAEGDLEVIRKSLNPITQYKLNVNDDVLSTKQNWNIV